MRAFVSYKWESKEHLLWIARLATVPPEPSNQVVHQHPARQPRTEANDAAEQCAGDAVASPRECADNGARQEAGAAEQQRDLDQAEGIVEDADIGQRLTAFSTRPFVLARRRSSAVRDRTRGRIGGSRSAG